ncbi:xanthine dehydrogenase accessory protein XdhC, partial [Paracoccaceae bacterium]|nr:xanthine dehydrogenase accessory protein XdhC [Paracoccaceae bacterium]
MGFDLDALTQAARQHGPIARVVVADVVGSTPRDTGASMLVWKAGQSGTIGGGALEYQAAHAARKAIEQGKSSALLSRYPLGPDLGQCCGGSVALVTEFFSTQSMPKADGNLLI